MANHTALAQRFVFENDRTGFPAMALGAALIKPRHGQPARGLKNVAAMRIVALDAIHPAFRNRMVLRQLKLGVNLQVALLANRWIFAGVDDEILSAARRNMFAAGAVTQFASRIAGAAGRGQPDARMRTGGELPHQRSMTVCTSFIAHLMRAGNFGNHGDRAVFRRAGRQGKNKQYSPG